MGEHTHSERARQLLLGSLRRLVRELDADALSDDEVLFQLEWFAGVQRLAAAGAAILAGRAARTDACLRSDAASAEAWLAKRLDVTVGEARALLGTSARLPSAPATNDAFRSGELSVAKADAVTAAVAVAPDAEAQLLDAAMHGSLHRVRQDAARVRAAADPDPEATHARIRRHRGWRRWTDADGSRCGTYRLTPDQGAIVEAAAQPFVDAAIDHARRSGADDTYDALAADGLAAMAQWVLDGDANGHDSSSSSDSGDVDDGEAARGPDDGGRGRGSRGGLVPVPRGARGRRRFRNRRELIGIVELASLLNGTDDRGQTCEIAGVGPVPLSVARELFGDALLRIVIRDGEDIRTVVHTGRTASAVQETAILIRQNGRCSTDHCDQPIAEIDHIDGYTVTGPVTLDGLDGKCGPHHDQKTRRRATRPRPAATSERSPP